MLPQNADDAGISQLTGCFAISQPRPTGNHNRGNSAARTKVAFHFCPHWTSPTDNILEHLIDNIFLEDSETAVGLQIFFQGFQFEAALLRHVADGDHTKVRQAGFGTDGSELWIVDHDLVTGKLVCPGFDLRELGVQSGLGVLLGVALLLRHENLL
jgi:hypothetical protein